MIIKSYIKKLLISLINVIVFLYYMKYLSFSEKFFKRLCFVANTHKQ